MCSYELSKLWRLKRYKYAFSSNRVYVIGSVTSLWPLKSSVSRSVCHNFIQSRWVKLPGFYPSTCFDCKPVRILCPCLSSWPGNFVYAKTGCYAKIAYLLNLDAYKHHVHLNFLFVDGRKKRRFALTAMFLKPFWS